MANKFVLELVGTFWYAMISKVQIPSPPTIRLSTHTHQKIKKNKKLNTKTT